MSPQHVLVRRLLENGADPTRPNLVRASLLTSRPVVAVPVGALIALVWPRLPFIRAMDPTIPQGLVSEQVQKDLEELGWRDLDALARDGIRLKGFAKLLFQFATIRTAIKHGNYVANPSMAMQKILGATLGLLGEMLGYSAVNAKYVGE
jgi:hypothetical protein